MVDADINQAGTGSPPIWLMACRDAKVTTDNRRDSRRGGDRIVFDGHQRASEITGKSLDDRIKKDQAEKRQRDTDRRRRDGSPDRRSRRPERRLDDDRCD